MLGVWDGGEMIGRFFYLEENDEKGNEVNSVFKLGVLKSFNFFCFLREKRSV